MRRHALASFAGSTSGTGSSRALFDRAFAARGASCDSKGSGAPSGRRRLTGVLSALAILLALAVSASPAAAVTTRLPLGFSPLTGAGSGLTLSDLTVSERASGIAVDETSGNVFLDAGNAVDILGAEGAAPVGLLSPFQITGFNFGVERPGVAVDNSPTSPSKGALYVADIRNKKVKKFVRNAITEKYEAAGELVPASAPPIEEPLGVAVDSHGNVFITSKSTSLQKAWVIKFSPTGAELARIDVTDSVGGQIPTSVAVDSAGDLFVASFINSKVVKYPANGSGEIEGGVFTQVTIPPVGTKKPTVAVDPATNRLYVGVGETVAQYDATTLVKQLEFGPGTLPTVGSSGYTNFIAVNSSNGRVYVTNSVGKNVVVFGPAVVVAGVSAAAATGKTPTKATANGTVNPDGVAVSECKFEYGTTTAYGTTVPCVGAIPTDSANHAVTANLTGLKPNATTYHYRLVATNANGTNVSADSTFTTTNMTVTAAATAIGATKATANGTVFPDGVAVSECKFEYGPTSSYGTTKPCAQTIPADEGEHAVSANLTGLVPNGAAYHFRLVVKDGSEPVNGADKTLVTANAVSTGAATAVLDHSATVNATVNPDGVAISECKFEYGPTSSYGTTKPCAQTIPTDSANHAVSAELTGLSSNSTTYHFRVVATYAEGIGPVSGKDETLTTLGAPRITEMAGQAVGQTAATLTAKINPDGLDTAYHFEWGQGASFDHRIPVEAETGIGSGSAPVPVSAELSSLEPNTTYRFRVVAANLSETVQEEGEFTTLNALNLPDDRGIELVSPADKRPSGKVQNVIINQLLYQAAEDGESVSYPILNALAGSTTAGETIYRSARADEAEGWLSEQVSPPSLLSSPETGSEASPAAGSGRVRYESPRDLRCAVIETFNPMTADTPKVDLANEVTNLYRRDATSGEYTLLTNLVPTNPTAASSAKPYFEVEGASEDCSRIFFRSNAFTFIPGASGLYEWDNGTLRDAGKLPNGAVPAGGVTYVSSAIPNNPVSRGGQLAFEAKSNQGKDSGKTAVFLRKSPTETVDASQSSTAVVPTGARYETSSADGSAVYFLGNYGLASSSSTGPANQNCSLRSATISEANLPCDLYRYDVGTGQLSDISADPNPADPQGATVVGAMAASADGSTVYFAARGQLVPGAGRTYAQNLEGAGFASVYRWHAGQLAYVGPIAVSNLIAGEEGGALASILPRWTSQTTENGDWLLYASSQVSAANPNGVREAYLYSAQSGADECISCPTDGALPLHTTNPVIAGTTSSIGFENYIPRSLSADGRAFFTSPDKLTPGATAGNDNIYEWHRGQVSLLASGAVHGKYASVQFIDSGGPEGRDVFIKSFARLNARDFDTVPDMYDFRAGGGFPEPSPPPVPCDPANGACQGTPASAPGSPSQGTAGAAGAGNPPLRPAPCPKGKVKKHGKCVAKKKPAHKKKQHKKAKHKKHHNRAANSHRGGAK